MTIQLKTRTARDGAELAAMGFRYERLLPYSVKEFRLDSDRNPSDVDLNAVAMIAREAKSSLKIDWN